MVSPGFTSTERTSALVIFSPSSGNLNSVVITKTLFRKFQEFFYHSMYSLDFFYRDLYPDPSLLFPQPLILFYHLSAKNIKLPKRHALHPPRRNLLKQSYTRFCQNRRFPTK